jgi:hypothetical protein
MDWAEKIAHVNLGFNLHEDRQCAACNAVGLTIQWDTRGNGWAHLCPLCSAQILPEVVRMYRRWYHPCESHIWARRSTELSKLRRSIPLCVTVHSWDPMVSLLIHG